MRFVPARHGVLPGPVAFRREVTVDERRRQLLAVEVLRRLELLPADVLKAARQNLATMTAADPFGHADLLLGRWSKLVDSGAEAVATVLVDCGCLRSSSA